MLIATKLYQYTPLGRWQPPPALSPQILLCNIQINYYRQIYVSHTHLTPTSWNVSDLNFDFQCHLSQVWWCSWTLHISFPIKIWATLNLTFQILKALMVKCCLTRLLYDNLSDPLQDTSFHNLRLSDPLQDTSLHNLRDRLQDTSFHNLRLSDPLQDTSLHNLRDRLQDTSFHNLSDPLQDTSLHNLNDPLQDASLHNLRDPLQDTSLHNLSDRLRDRSLHNLNDFNLSFHILDLVKEPS